MDKDDCVCAIEVPEILQASKMQVALHVDIASVSPRHAKLRLTARHDYAAEVYAIDFVLAQTSMQEGVEIIRRLFGAELEVTYWYFVDSGSAMHALLGATLGQEPNHVTFKLHGDGAHNTQQLWRQFGERIRQHNTDWTHIKPRLDHLEIRLADSARSILEEVLLRLVRNFSFG
jgi:hypothetical protein